MTRVYLHVHPQSQIFSLVKLEWYSKPPRYNNKTYKVDDIAFDKKASDMVELKGVRISYIDYYKKTYPDVKIRWLPIMHNQILRRMSAKNPETSTHSIYIRG